MADYRYEDRTISRDRGGERGPRFFGSDREDRDYSSRSMGGGYGERDRMMERGRGGDERRYGPDDFNRGVPMDETRRLIASNKVEGTAVYGRDGEKLGSIHNFMVDKRSGQVEYAVLKYSNGFLGLGERYCPVEWDQLTYDTRLDGYHIDMTERELKRRTSYDRDGRQDDGTGGYGRGRDWAASERW